MAVKRPLANYSGTIKELATGDSLAGVEFASASTFNAGTNEDEALNSKIVRENGWVYGSLIPTTSGDPIEILTGLPAWVTEIEIFLDRISCSGTNNILVQQRTASGYVVTGYSSNSANALNSNVASDSSTAGHLIRQTDASYDYICYIQLSKGDGDIWFSKIMCRRSDGGVVWGAGNVDLGGDCTGVRIDTDGSNTFDNGSAIGRYR